MAQQIWDLLQPGVLHLKGLRFPLPPPPRHGIMCTNNFSNLIIANYYPIFKFITPWMKIMHYFYFNERTK